MRILSTLSNTQLACFRLLADVLQVENNIEHKVLVVSN